MGIRSIAVLGAGNGGCASAADLAARGFEVRLYNRSRGRIEPLIERGGLDRHGEIGEGFVSLSLITDDLSEAIADADLVMLTVPISAHPFFAERLGLVLPEDAIVFLNPGHMGGGLFLAHEVHRLTGRSDVRTCEVSTLAYACRMSGPASIRVMSVTRTLPFAAFPGRYQDELFGLLRPLYPNMIRAHDVLETGFMDINAVEHPPQILCNAGWVEHTRGEYLFYYEGTTPAVGRVIDAVDVERVAIARSAGIPTKPFVEVFHEMGYTTERAARLGTAHAALRESTPNRWVKGPPDLDHRYVHEDVGWGLVPWSELARSLGVPTPVMDALITLASAMNARDYRAEGLTLDRLGLAGIPVHAWAEYFQTGIPDRSGRDDVSKVR